MCCRELKFNNVYISDHSDVGLVSISAQELEASSGSDIEHPEGVDHHGSAALNLLECLVGIGQKERNDQMTNQITAATALKILSACDWSKRKK